MSFLLDEAKVDEYVHLVNERRKKYIENPNYVGDLCNIMLQKMNLKGNDISVPASYSAQPITEFMAIYQQLFDVYPEEFTNRNISLLKESMHKSIYSTVHSGLFPNYINELRNNDPDSFLVIPVFASTSSEERVAYQGITAILKKEKGFIGVEIYDKSPRLETQVNEQPKLITPIGKYTLKDTPDNVFHLADTLRLGRLHLSPQELNLIKQGHMPSDQFFHQLNRLAVSKSVSNHVSMVHFSQKNFEINNLAGALKYVLGKKEAIQYPLKNGELAAKSKFESFDTKKLNFILVQLTAQHLEKLGYDQTFRGYLESQYATYNHWKESRKGSLNSFTLKLLVNKSMNSFYKGEPYRQIFSKKELNIDLNCGYGLESNYQQDPEKAIDYSTKNRLWCLSQDEIKKIREACDYHLSKEKKDKRKLSAILTDLHSSPTKKHKNHQELEK